MVKLRLKRMGNAHRPFYRIGVVDERKKRDGALIEEVGHFNPVEKDEAKQLTVKKDRVAYWLSVGARPSDTVATLLKRVGLEPKSGTKLAAQKLDA